MGLLFRSEDMTHVQMVLQAEAAYSIVNALGNQGKLQFIDLNPDFNTHQRRYISDVYRCEEMARKLEYITKEVKRAAIPRDSDPADEPEPDVLEPNNIIQLEVKLDELEHQIKENNRNTETLMKNYNTLVEHKETLRTSTELYASGNELDVSDDNAGYYSRGERQALNYVQGVIEQERIPAFEKVLWRIGHGNIFMKWIEIEDKLLETSSVETKKCVFVVFYQGDSLQSRVKKICEGFHASLHPVPDNAAERKDMLHGLSNRVDDLKTIIEQTKAQQKKILVETSREFEKWTIIVKKMKAIFFTLNMFNYDDTHKVLIAEGWCPTKLLPDVREGILKGQIESGSPELTPFLNILETVDRKAPTYFRTNKFTKVFQNIVNAYGVPNYHEINGAPFYTISFPFLFGVMFGDIGHGFCVFLVGAYLLWNEKAFTKSKGENDIFDMFFSGRYIILLMGLFAIYGGLLYNDIFSKSIDLFGTAWFAPTSVYTTPVVSTTEYITLNPTLDYSHVPYPFGMDPMWELTVNKITWLNSFKMKMSVIIGVTQMFFGVCLSFVNSLYFRNGVNFLCEFIPQVIFLASIFGYMNIMIFYKWFAYNAIDSSCAPALLIEIIDMALFDYPSSPCNVMTFYPNQKMVQEILVLLALICIPWLLVPKPLILKKRHEKEEKLKLEKETMKKGQDNLAYSSMDPAHPDAVTIEMESPKALPPPPKKSRSDDDEEEFIFSEVFVHQAIHTIEYCLGCVSHTASYLRLWALSLAHAELSEVIWDMVLMIAFKFFTGIPQLFVLFFFWAGWCWLTIGIMLMMEGLSAFLHTLRLHWVEFQSKFYKGEGNKFSPLYFKKILRQKEE